MQLDFTGKRVLVTGGTGFIGGRLVERLVSELGADVRVLVRNYARATRVARFPVELRGGDLTDPQAVESAVEGCDYVFNCAYGNSGTPAQQRAVNVDGLENVLSAASGTGVRRVVHVSTVAVYGTPSTEILTEESPRPPASDPYASSKLESEQVAARHAAKGVPVTVVQPTCVYGPFSPSWTIRILGDLKARRVLLVDGGSGLCNPVHVDDVVDAMLHAALVPEAVGQTFLVSGPEPVTWKRFYGAHERMLGFESTVSLSAAEAEARWKERLARKSLLRESLGVLRSDGTARSRVRNSREVDLLRRAARRLVPASLRSSFKARLKGKGKATTTVDQEAKPLMLMPPPVLAFHAARTRVSTAKAERVLGWKPAFDFERGMRSTEAWARWAGLLDR